MDDKNPILKELWLRCGTRLLDIKYMVECEYPDVEMEWNDPELVEWQAERLELIALQEAIQRFCTFNGMTVHELLYGVTLEESLK